MIIALLRIDRHQLRVNGWILFAQNDFHLFIEET